MLGVRRILFLELSGNDADKSSSTSERHPTLSDRAFPLRPPHPTRLADLRSFSAKVFSVLPMSLQKRGPRMQDRDLFLCSQLMKVSASQTTTVGNLEDICATTCTVAVEVPPPIGAQVSIRCIGCPLGKKPCTDCRFRGSVRSHENDPVLGCLMQIEFEGRMWSAEEWHPEHLTKIEPLVRGANA